MNYICQIRCLCAVAVLFGSLTICPILDLGAEELSNMSFNATNMDDLKRAVEYLRNLNISNPSDQRIRQELARAYNFYAIQLAKSDLDLALDYMQRAVDAEPDNKEYSGNLSQLHFTKAHGYFKAGHLPKALQGLSSALSSNPDNTAALILIGQIYYSDSKLQEALNAWGRALAIGPYDAQVAAKLEQIKKELSNQTAFRKRETQNFVFMFDRELDEFQFGNMENILNEVYVKVGQDFNYFPSYRVTVLVYTPQRYRLEVEPSENIIGRYDGAIRLPEYASKEARDYRRIVYHEYMHAMVYDLSGNRAPRWLHEGLSTYQDPGFKLDIQLLEQLSRAAKLPGMGGIESNFLDLNNSFNLTVGYNLANALIKYFLARHNFWHMKNILVHLRSGLTVDEAFRKEINTGVEDFYNAWKEETFRNK